MSKPRIVIPGKTWHITRRTVLRHFLLVPSEALTNLFRYILIYAAKKYGIQVHALCVMSNHYHMVLTDTRGTLPRFLQEFNRVVALGVKCIHGWEDQVWESKPAKEIELRKPQAIIAAIAYVMANPVAAGSVEHAHQWPGAITLPHELGNGVIKATRPSFYFDPKNPQWEEEMTLPITLPPNVTQEEGARFRSQVAIELMRLEKKAHREMREKGWSFLGAVRVMRLSPTDRAKKPKPRVERNPTFAVGQGNAEALKEAIEERRAFLSHYYQALEKWRAGDRDVVFPAGTWWMRVFHNAKTAEVI